jgi:transposase InsO family protein
MAIIHKYIRDVPQLKGNAFYLCQSCVYGKQVRRAMRAAHKTINQTIDGTDNIDWLDLNSPVTQDTPLQAGEMYHMDFGFPRGQKFSSKDDQGRLITSIDGHRAYLLIIDRKTRYIWVALTKNKLPPCEYVAKFLEIQGRKSGNRIIRTDQGGELWGSYKFRETIQKAGYLPQPTAPGAPFQNGMAERPNQLLGNYMRCMLHSANLGPEFWSYALIQAVRVYNMLPHTATQQHHIMPSWEHIRQQNG